jgi:hypothetical protein
MLFFDGLDCLYQSLEWRALGKVTAQGVQLSSDRHRFCPPELDHVYQPD